MLGAKYGGKEGEILERNEGDKDEREAAPSMFDIRRIVVIQACVDQRRNPRRGSEERGEEEQDLKLRRKEWWESVQ